MQTTQLSKSLATIRFICPLQTALSCHRAAIPPLQATSSYHKSTALPLLSVLRYIANKQNAHATYSSSITSSKNTKASNTPAFHVKQSLLVAQAPQKVVFSEVCKCFTNFSVFHVKQSPFLQVSGKATSAISV